MVNLVPGEPSSHHAMDDSLSRDYNNLMEDGGRWYFSRKEIEENSPSRKDGIDLKKEAYLRKSYCTFLQDLGMRLKVPQLTIATAIIFCHRFFLRQSHAKNDRRTIATVCMFLAGKVEETPRPLKDVILVSYEIINKKDPEAIQRIKQKEVYEQQKELVLQGERVVLATLGFDLNVQHPYKPLVDSIKKFKVAQNALAQVAWNFVNDGLRTSLSLQFKPHHIAAGAIFLAAKFLKVKLPSDGEKVWWQEFDVTPRQLEEVSNQMLELYEQNRVQPSTNSEAEGSTVGGAADRGMSKVSSGNDAPAIANFHSQAGNAGPKPGTVRPYADGQSEHFFTHQSQGNDYASMEMNSASDHHTDGESKDDMRHETETYPSTEVEKGFRVDSDGSGKEDHGRNNIVRSEAKEGALAQSTQDVIKKIDRDKVKAALEKWRKSRGEMPRKKDVLDDDDLIERELEDGIELAVDSEKNKQDRKQSWSNSKPNLDRKEHENTHKSELTYMEEGEVPLLDNMDQGHRSPRPNKHKRKAWSSPDKAPRNDHSYYHHDFSDDRSKASRPGFVERDHKKHAPENHS